MERILKRLWVYLCQLIAQNSSGQNQVCPTEAVVAPIVDSILKAKMCAKQSPVSVEDAVAPIPRSFSADVRSKGL